jgi:hypothetical protein
METTGRTRSLAALATPPSMEATGKTSSTVVHAGIPFTLPVVIE